MRYEEFIQDFDREDRPKLEENDMLIINPGSAYEPRSGMPPSVAVLEVDEQKISAKIIYR